MDELTHPPSAAAEAGSETPGQSMPEELAARAARGDEVAFQQLHDRFSRGLVGFLARKSGEPRDVVEELAQQAWMESFCSLRAGKFDAGRARFSTFLYAVGWKMVLRRRRSQGQRARLLQGASDWLRALVGEAREPDDSMQLAELLDALGSCTRSAEGALALTAEERSIVLRAVAGESERHLASSLGVAPSTVNGKKQKALRKLRLCLSHKGFKGWRVQG